ncbi:MAG: Ureidoglycolate lyase [Acidobacteria bacterium]|nr:Ureidoglycolate lyase [Acidobacteriota bacterium]
MNVARIFRVELASGARHVVERDGRWHVVEGSIFGAWTPGAELPTPGRLLAPVEPSKIVAVGLNYRDHAAERNKPLPREPMIFLKPSTTVIGTGEAIRLPAGVGRVDHEAELGVVIGRRASRVARARALEHVLGLTCINDVTARDLQDRGVQYSHVKGFDTFAPLGPAVAVGLDAADLRVEGLVNGQVRQASTTAQLIFPVDVLIEYITAIMTLLPGDVIATGTPAGIGPLAPGDSVTVRIEGIGELTNPVEARA